MVYVSRTPRVVFLQQQEQLWRGFFLETCTEARINPDIGEFDSAYECVDIKARAACNNGEFAAFRYVFDDRAGAVDKILSSKDFLWGSDIQEMVPYAAHFTLRNFPGADVEAAIDLARIGRYHLAVEFSGKFDGKPALAGGGRTHDNYDFLFSLHSWRIIDVLPGWRNWQTQTTQDRSGFGS